MAASWGAWAAERTVTLSPTCRQPFRGSSRAAICRAVTGAQVPFSSRAKPRFYRPWEAMSRRTSSMVINTPPL